MYCIIGASSILVLFWFKVLIIVNMFLGREIKFRDI